MKTDRRLIDILGEPEAAIAEAALRTKAPELPFSASEIVDRAVSTARLMKEIGMSLSAEVVISFVLVSLDLAMVWNIDQPSALYAIVSASFIDNQKADP